MKKSEDSNCLFLHENQPKYELLLNNSLTEETLLAFTCLVKSIKSFMALSHGGCLLIAQNCLATILNQKSVAQVVWWEATCLQTTAVQLRPTTISVVKLVNWFAND